MPALNNLKNGIKRCSWLPSSHASACNSVKIASPICWVLVLAAKAIPLADLDAAAIAAQIKNAEYDVADAKSDETRAKANETLDYLKSLQLAF
jgi:hypothetical protein